MPRYKKSPEERAAEKERKDTLFNFFRDYGIEKPEDFNTLFKDMIGVFYEKGLEAELDDELGYSKYDYRNKECDNSRNGYSKKTLKTSYGDSEISIPRDRNGDFEPQLLKKIRHL